MSKIFAAAFVVFLILLAVGDSVRAQNYTTSDGFSFEVSFSADKTEIMVGEPVYLSMGVKNLSNVDFCIVDGGDYRNNLGRPQSFSIEAVHDDNLKVPVPEIKFWMGGLISCRKAEKNGGTFVFHLFLPLWAPFETPGNYILTVKKLLIIRDYNVKSEYFKELFSETNVPVKLETKIKVIPTDYEKMGKIIEFWENELNQPGEFDRAVRALIYIDDKRTIKPLISIAKKDYQAMLRLADFDDEEAFHAIVAEIKNADDRTRLSVADALSISKNPKAYDYLLKMRGDEYEYVRLRVMNFLGEKGTAESLKIFKEMADEPRNKDLLQYVTVYLEKLEKK
ncbi:MAG TPA: hypothetical protein VGC76_15955 [Pyrinomonadaceae bacterium]|jgi:hypothetical protein